MLITAIIPLFKQSSFLIEAVTSILSQTHAANIVIVNDGCPDSASDDYGVAYSRLAPGRLTYVKQHNRGLSGARNTGIRHALKRWPDTEAFFFLDADNFLAPDALQIMAGALAQSADAGWVYPVQQRFGEDASNWYSHSPANLFHMLFHNQCDAGSLVRRSIFDAGVFFDETIRKGYEDWEFFIRALRHGFSGRSAGECGFYYRVRRHSMLTESVRQHEQLLAELNQRHGDLFQPRELTNVEHVHCPRFLWADETRQTAFTDPEAATAPSPPAGYHPPVLVLGAAAALAELKRTKMLRSVLLLCQAMTPAGSVRITLRSTENSLSITRNRRKSQSHIIAFHSGALQNSSGFSLARARQLLRRSHDFIVDLPSDPSRFPSPLGDDVVDQILSRLSRTGIFSEPARRFIANADVVQTTSRSFSWNKNCRQLETTYPYIGHGAPHVGFAVPWLKLGGVDLCVMQLAAAMKRLVPGLRLSLVTTESGIGYGAEAVDLFDDIVCLQQLDKARSSKLCDSTLGSMDLVVNAHAMTAYEALAMRSRSHHSSCRHISYLHVIDQPRGRPSGFPYVAAAMEASIDGFAVISENLKSFLINQGVAPFRIKMVPNAPVVQPPTYAVARRMASAKAERLAVGERPLRLLFAGRTDYQKGISRLKALVQLLSKKNMPIELTIVGDAVIERGRIDWPAPYVRVLPPTRDPDTLSRYYAEHDAFLLLSRWEGVPLALLDAMAHGCTVIATDVGAVSELVSDKRNGILVSNGTDAEVATQAEAAIEAILADCTGGHSLRQAAVETAWSFTWDAAARSMLSFLPEFPSSN